jgi:diguanylate cyclase
MTGDQPVISDAILAKVLNVPAVVFAIPVLKPDGQHAGVLAASIDLTSAALFSQEHASAHRDGGTELIVDRRGRVIVHPDKSRVFQPAAAEPGLQRVVADWIASGSPIDTTGTASVEGSFVVARTGVPLTDWVSFRVEPASLAFRPVADARAAALPAIITAAIAAGLLAGSLA